jgi:hypothetical protein
MWRTSHQFNERQKRLRVLILGSYKDDKKAILCELKVQLVALGFKNCRLVEDFSYCPESENAEDEPYQKSIYWIDRADMCILVFFGRGYDDGLHEELIFIVDRHLLSKCVLTYERNLKAQKVITSLFAGCVSDLSNRCMVMTYDDIKELVERTSGQLFNVIYNRAVELDSRVDQDWELDQR